jgi:hypothetical protein
VSYEQRYEQTMAAFRQAQEAALDFIAGGPDWAARDDIKINFRELGRDLREFARNQYGVGAPRVKPGRRRNGA